MPGLRAMPEVMTTMSEPGSLVVAVRAGDDRVVPLDRAGLAEIERLALRQSLDDVHEHDVRVVALRETLRGRATDHPRTHDGNLLPRPCHRRIPSASANFTIEPRSTGKCHRITAGEKPGRAAEDAEIAESEREK